MTQQMPLILDSQSVNSLLQGKATRLLLPGAGKSLSGQGGDGFSAKRRLAGRGDVLWVREQWCHENYPYGPYQSGALVFYRADYLDDPLGADFEHCPDGSRRDWLPVATMPRAICRLMLHIVMSCPLPASQALKLGGYANAHALAETVRSTGQPDLFGHDPRVWLLEFKVRHHEMRTCGSGI